MRTFNNTVMALGLLGAFNFYALAGDIKPGSVPGSLNYQGRLERDNAPITGPIFLTFRIYNAMTGGDPATCGNPGAVCRWAGPEVVVNAAQGIFSASITPPWNVFSAGETLYLEVQVESDVLTPREPLNSVAYAFAAKKLEDGASVSLSTLSAAYQVLLATRTDSKVGIGTNSPAYKLSVNGSIKLMSPTDAIYFFDGTSMNSSGVGSAVGGVTSAGASTIESDTSLLGGAMSFNTSAVERMRIADAANSGRIGIGAGALAAPLGTVDIDGSLYVSDAGGIYDRNDGELNVKQDLVAEGGRFRGAGNNYISMGETADTLIAATNNAPRLWLDPSGNLGVGAAAAASERIHSNGNIRSDTGLRGSAVSVGAYTGWTSLANEVRGQTDLLLQQSNLYNVGIGTNTPREKLHVRGNIRADYGIIAASATFSDSVSVAINGDFTANSGHGNMVYLSSTIVYGTLQVTGGVGSSQGFPGYLASTQTFTGQNTFLNQVTFSSDIVTMNRVGAGVNDFDFPALGSKYLQIGDNKPEFDAYDAAAYLVSGNSADSKIHFYRGAAEAARFETQTGNNLALVVGNTKSLVDGTYYRVQNSVVWISTGYATTPAVYVSSAQGSVGIGTAVADPNHRLTVEGNIRISTSSSPGKSYGIIFADGTTLNSANPGGLSVGSVANNNDAVVQSDLDSNGSGGVILRAGAVDGLMLNSGGNIGIGTVSPISKLNVRGGDLVLGAPSIGSYASNGVEDLIVAGNLVVDGGLLQRSATPVVFTGLTVSGNVFLSTTSAAVRTGIGTDTPGYKLDVQGGDINASGGIRTGNVTRITAAGAWSGAAVEMPYGGTGADLSGAAVGGLIYKSGAAALAGTAALTGVLKGTGAGAPAAMTGTADTVTRWTDANTIGDSVISDNGTNVGISAAPTGGIKLDVNGKLRTATFQLTGGASLDYVLTSDAGGNATWQDLDLFGDSRVGNEVKDATNSTLTRSGAGTKGDPYTLALNLGNSNTWTAAQTFSGGVGLTGVLKGNGAGALTASDVVLTSEVSGILPEANGGTGNAAGNAATATSVPQSGVNLSTVTTALSGKLSNTATVPGGLINLSTVTAHILTMIPSTATGNYPLTAANVSGTVAVLTGGTGASGFTQNGVLYGNNAAAINVTAAGAASTVLRGTGGAPTFGKIDSNYTTGATGTFDVARTTTTPAQCRELTVINGLITAIGADHDCD